MLGGGGAFHISTQTHNKRSLSVIFNPPSPTKTWHMTCENVVVVNNFFKYLRDGDVDAASISVHMEPK